MNFDSDGELSMKTIGDENENEKGDTITLYTKDLRGIDETYKVRPDDKISTLVDAYVKRNKIKSSTVTFTLDAKTLDSRKTFQDYQIKDSDILYVLVKFKGGL